MAAVRPPFLFCDGVNIRSFGIFVFCLQVVFNLQTAIFHSFSYRSIIVLLAAKRTKSPGTRAQQSLTPLARELPCRQYHSSVPRLPFQSFLPSAGCCGTRSVRLYGKIYTRTALKQPRTMACIRQGFTLCCLRCRFLFDNTIVRPLQKVIRRQRRKLRVSEQKPSLFELLQRA